MNIIHKFPLQHGSPLHLNDGFMVRHVADQLGTVCAWIELFVNLPARMYTVHKAGTGELIPAGAMYLGTVLESHGQFVWHFYAVPHAG